MELNINNYLPLMSKCEALHFDISQTTGDPLPELDVAELTGDAA